MRAITKAKSAFAAALAMFIAAPTGVYAEGVQYETSSATIDTSKKGSITLYKYVDNNGKSVDASGVQFTGNSQDMLAEVRKQVGDNDIFPEAGVKFKTVKIADIEQVTEDTKGDAANGSVNATGTYYTNIDKGFWDLVQEYLGPTGLVASEATKITDGRETDPTSHPDDHFESDDLNEVIMKLNRAAAKAVPPSEAHEISKSVDTEKETATSVTGEVALNRYLRSRAAGEGPNDAKEFPVTNEHGYTKVEGLDLGLYLTCEVDWQHTALSKHDAYWERVEDGKNDALTGDKGDTEDAGNGNSGITAGGAHAGGSTYADIASPSSPFLLSIPMTNIADIQGKDGVLHKAGTVWQYDITAYPKNGTINIHKDIVTNDYAGTTDGKTNPDGKPGVDGNDKADSKTTCDFVQTNYLPTDGTEDKVDGKQKSGLVHQIDANMGDVVTQLVSADVPRLVDDLDNEDKGPNHANKTRKHNKTYKISDRMTKGLKMNGDGNFKVTLSTGAWNDYAPERTTLFQQGTDYKVEIADDKQSYVLTVLQPGLEKMDDIPAASYLYVRYDVEVTNDALIGTDTYGNQRVVVKGQPSSESQEYTPDTAKDQIVKDESKKDVTYTNENGVSHPEATNQNTARLTYATDRTMEHDYYSNTTKVFTYEINLTKLFTDGTAGGGDISKNAANAEKNDKTFNYSQVKFTVRGSVDPKSEDGVAAGGNWEQIIFKKVGDGVYKVFDDNVVGTDGAYKPDSETLDTPSQDVTRFVTPNSKTGLLNLIGLDARTYEFTEVATATGRNLMAEPFFAEIVAPVVSGKTLENGKVEHAYVYTGKRPADKDLTKYDLAVQKISHDRLEEGRVPFTVQNNEVIKVLKTGGTGTTLIIAAGLGIMTVGAYFFMKKRNEAQDDQPIA